MRIEHHPPLVKFNYAEYHCGSSSWDRVAVKNTGNSSAGPVLIRVTWSDLAQPHLIAIPKLEPGASTTIGNHILPLVDHQRLQELRERKEVVWDVQWDDMIVHRSQVQVLAYNEWTWSRGAEASLSVFVQPTSHAVTEIVSAAKLPLENRTGCSTYQEAFEKGHGEVGIGGPANSWSGMAASIYDFIHDRCHWTYEYEPPCFELDSQKLVFPDEVWRWQQGTCVDLAVAYVSCLERIHLRPIIVVLRRGNLQHALAGWWVSDHTGFGPVLDDKSSLVRLLCTDLQLVECTGFASGDQGAKPIAKTDFDSACRSVHQTMASWDLWAAVDVSAARQQLGMTPLPTSSPGTSPWDVGLREFFEQHHWPIGIAAMSGLGIGWFTNRGASILGQAIREAVIGGRGELTTRHLVLALLGVEGGATDRTVRQLGADPAWLRGKLIRKVRPERPVESKPVVPSDAVTATIKRLWNDCVLDQSILVGEAEIFRGAILDKQSVTIREFLRDLQFDQRALLRTLDAVARHPAVQTDPSSGGFPDP